jgi:hypothetical protein
LHTTEFLVLGTTKPQGANIHSKSTQIDQPKMMHLQRLTGLLFWAFMSRTSIASTQAEPVDTAPAMALQEHRTLLFGALFPARTKCVSDEATLLQRLQSSDGGEAIALCSGTNIRLSTAIDMTKLSFELRCEGKSGGFLFRLRRRKAPASSKCVISGDGKTRLFIGSPTLATFDGLEFRDARADGNEDGDQGGAFFIKEGGSVTFRHCAFQSNQGKVRGVPLN